jgi:glycosyltransferase involved in cell wall biosynthesis
LPFNSNPFDIVQNARFTVLTSHYEGFPMSMVESLALGTPVVTVDCNSGPREIVIDE